MRNGRRIDNEVEIYFKSYIAQIITESKIKQGTKNQIPNI